MMYIGGKGKEEYLTGEIETPKPDDPKYKNWKTDNHMIKSWLVSSMNNDIGENFLLYSTAKELWDAVKDSYSSSDNTSELFEIEAALYDLRQEDTTVTQYFNTLTRFWHQLDLFETYSWKCADDTALYRSIVEKRRSFKFLHGLNKELDAVRSRIMSIKPLPTIKEAFSEVRHEESRKKVMMGASPLPSTQESSALAARGQQKGRPWCDHCRKPGHFRETCWKLHGKPADWKLKSWKDKESHGNVAATLNTAAVIGNGDTSDSSPFTKAQLEALQKLLSQSHITAKPDTTPGTGHLAMKGIGFGEDDWQC
ncbi:uncharacterized protein LOC133819988 [Humulus lupulus]|uniref:uncharacterized protein LOC133819988 n=1 Tax=Humulus lupulus TaxID=3486 RepID=UPI002B411513|nr:uncharacterized protein LOC133819988 [Humulus lupulus]